MHLDNLVGKRTSWISPKFHPCSCC